MHSAILCRHQSSARHWVQWKDVSSALPAQSSSLIRRRCVLIPKLKRTDTAKHICVTASAAVWGTPAGFNERGDSSTFVDVDAPLPLPATPKSSDFMHVLPYLAKLALSEKTLYWRLAIALALMVLSKATGLLAPVYFKHAVDALGKNAVSATVAALLISGVCRVLNGISKEMQHPCFTPISQAAGRRVAYHTFAHVLDLDIGFHLERRTGALSRVLERGTRSIAVMFRAIVFTFIPTMVELILVAAVLARNFNPIVAVLVVATFVTYVAWTILMTAAAADIRKEVNVLDNQTTGKAVDALLNYETVALFNNQALEVSEYDTVLSKLQKVSIKTEGISATLNAGQSVVLSVGLTAVLAMAAMGSSSATMTAGDLVLVQGLLLQLWGPLQFLGWFYRELRQSLVDLDAFIKVLQTQNSLPDGDQELPIDNIAEHTSHSASVLSNGSGLAHPEVASSSGLKLEMQNLHFSYNPDREVLKGVNISVAPGQSIAIVGPSGSGKSTLLRLIVRLYDPSQGRIVLNGVDVRNLTQSSLRNSVAVVPQDTVLFNDTIYRNIAYGRPGATKAEVEQAVRRAQLTEAISRMTDGYMTIVGERGLKLSGGEKQRVAIARAFLREPRLLICDEATSALDTATERGIMDSLTELADGRTSVFVAHRLSTIRNCDKIIVMSAGKVVEEGSHADLMAAGRVYSDMWAMQAEAEKAEDRVCLEPTTWEHWQDHAGTGAAGSNV